jgi:Ca2+-binding EF-hand superfamily protein
MATQAELDDWFAAFDADKNGKIDAKELKTVVKAYYEFRKLQVEDVKVDDDVREILREVDTSGDGKIDKSEFFKYFSK